MPYRRFYRSALLQISLNNGPRPAFANGNGLARRGLLKGFVRKRKRQLPLRFPLRSMALTPGFDQRMPFFRGKKKHFDTDGALYLWRREGRGACMVLGAPADKGVVFAQKTTVLHARFVLRCIAYERAACVVPNLRQARCPLAGHSSVSVCFFQF